MRDDKKTLNKNEENIISFQIKNYTYHMLLSITYLKKILVKLLLKTYFWNKGGLGIGSGGILPPRNFGKKFIYISI